MKKLMVFVGALLFAGSISAASYHGYGCGRGHVSVGFYAPPVYYAPVVVERPMPRYYDAYEHRGYREEYREHRRGCHEGYRGGYYR